MGNKEIALKKGNELSVEKRSGDWLTPAVDIFETEEAVTLVADLPGMGKENLQLGVEASILTLQGPADTGDDAFYHEFGANGYYRRFQLPDNLDLEKIAAELRNGVLTVTLPKAAVARPRRIEVSVH
ncbi:Hsp20/alpha crystallin family protein [Desulfuromonas sp. TF]|uniref:Hsp20/alpha crystallin family protein n=1 Tax=Desulfuromonas sp. TF TaxID=1232410 RepID=UPI000413797A|nr:Hsp20/alpha crystallin family protein [Desulfuromonas sp. TF]